MVLVALRTGNARAQAQSESKNGTAPAEQVATTPTGTAEQAEVRKWTGEVEAGGVVTSGNSESQSLRARLKLQHEAGSWKEGVAADYVKVSEQGADSAEQFTATLRADRTLTKRSYLYADGRYEANRAAGLSPRVAETAGYGRRFLFSEQVRLETEAGVGGRHTWATDGTRKSEPIGRLAVNFLWQFGAASEFSEKAFSEFGDRNVYSESNTSLKTRIDSSFSLKINLAVKHNTVVPEAQHKTDSITSVTLVYDL